MQDVLLLPTILQNYDIPFTYILLQLKSKSKLSQALSSIQSVNVNAFARLNGTSIPQQF